MVLARSDGGQELAAFAPVLRGLDPADLGEVRDIACGVFAKDLVIGYVNAPWIEFGRANGATRPWGPGDRLLDAISGPLRDFYAERLAAVLEGGAPWDHDYECSSDGVYRAFHLRAVVLGDSAGLLINHSLRVERAHDLAEHAFDRSLYTDPYGLVKLCGHCRRTRRAAGPSTWDWVPSILAGSMHRVSHGLCELCFAYYFGPDALG